MMNDICAAIYQYLRERAKLTQAALGLLIGVSRYTIAKFESGRSQRLMVAAVTKKNKFLVELTGECRQRVDRRGKEGPGVLPTTES